MLSVLHVLHVSILLIMAPKAFLTQKLITVGMGVQKSNEEWDIQKLGFHLEPPVGYDGCLRDDRGGIHRLWADSLRKKLIVVGWAGCVGPAASLRQAYYALTAETDNSKPGLDQ